MRLSFLLLLMAFSLTIAGAQEVGLGAGRLHGIGEKEATYSWQLQYFQHFNEAWAGSLSWVNEGHLPGHHRDGVALQVWRFHRMERNSLRLGVGLGAYRTFDTTLQPEGDYHNLHSLRPLLGLRAQYPWPGSAWEGFVQLNRTLGSGPATQSALVGVSTRFGCPAPSAPRMPPREEPPNELAFLFGRTILNSFESEATELLQSFAVEYRRRLARHVELSFTYCDEGGIDAARRDGLAAQIWLTTRRPAGGWLLGFGMGPYFSRVYPETGSGSDTVNIRTSLRYSMVVGRHLWGNWGGRLQWNRTLTLNHRDTDVLLAGVAYAW